MRIVLVIRLILVVFQLDKVRVDCRGIKGKGDERVNFRSLRDELERPGL